MPTTIWAMPARPSSITIRRWLSAVRLATDEAKEAVWATWAIAYFDLGEVRKAIEYYDQALAISREIGDPWIEGRNLCNFGKAYAALGETDKAIEYYEQTLEIVRKIEDRKE